MKNKKIKSLIASLLMVSAIIPSLVFIGVSSNTLKNESEVRFKSDTRRILSNLTQVTKSYDKSLSAAYLLVESDSSWLTNISDEKYFNRFSDTIKSISSLVGSSLHDIGIYSLETNQLMDKDGNVTIINPENYDWYNEAMIDKDKLIEVDTVVGEDNNVYVTYAKTLSEEVKSNDKTTKVQKGVMYITLSLKELTSIAQNIVITSNSNLYVLDKNYNVMYDRSGIYNGQSLLNEDWLFDVLRAKNGKFMDSIVSHEDVLIYKEVDSLSNISIVATVPYSDINKAVLTSLKPTIIFAIIIMVIIISSGYVFIRIISKPFAEIIEEIKPLKDGDFSSYIAVKETYPIEVQDMVGTLNDVVGGISIILKKIKDISNIVESNSSSLSDITESSYCIVEGIVASAYEITNDTESSVNKAEELSTVVNELSDEIKIVRNISTDILTASEKVSDLSEEGKSSMSELKKSFDSNNKLTLDVIESISEVSNVSGAINNITNTMREITQQTNMLSLNASIEAAKAGDSGKGFAVVANQIRTLSEQSEHLTKEIDLYVDSISRTVSTLENKIGILSDINNDTFNVVDITSEKFLNIIHAIESLNERLSVVGDSVASIEQKRDSVVENLEDVKKSSVNISKSTNEVSISMQEQSAQLEEVTASAIELSKLASELKELLSQFIINKEDGDINE